MTILIFVLIFALALELFVRFIEISGFSSGDAFAIAVLPLLASYLPPVKIGKIEELTVYLSFAGFIIPASIALKQVVTGNVSGKKALAGFILLTAVCYLVSNPGSEGVGITYPALPIVTASVYSLVVEREKPAPLAYTSATLGMFAGADLLNLPRLVSKTICVTIGGAGVFDAIYMTGLAALIFDATVFLVKKVLIRNLSQPKT